MVINDYNVSYLKFDFQKIKSFLEQSRFLNVLKPRTVFTLIYGYNKNYQNVVLARFRCTDADQRATCISIT